MALVIFMIRRQGTLAQFNELVFKVFTHQHSKIRQLIFSCILASIKLFINCSIMQLSTLQKLWYLWLPKDEQQTRHNVHMCTQVHLIVPLCSKSVCECRHHRHT